MANIMDKIKEQISKQFNFININFVSQSLKVLKRFKNDFLKILFLQLEKIK